MSILAQISHQLMDECAREPIRIPGVVQPFATLLAFDAEFIIRRCSENTLDSLGVQPSGILGRGIGDVFNPMVAASVRTAFTDHLPGTLADLGLICPPRSALAHTHAGEHILELVAPDREHPLESSFRQTEAFADTLKEASHLLTVGKTVEEYSQLTTEMLRERTGYDRVMVYQFNDDWHGEVIAEARRPDLEPYLGLNYPASDIPPQARELYLANRVRVLSDVLAEPVPVISDRAIGELDLSFALSRGFSPIHREYLTNMGVRSTLTASIVRDGRLWGLIACHHSVPHLPSAPTRALVGAVSSMVAVQTELFESRERNRGVVLGQSLLHSLPDVLDRADDWAEGLVSSEAGLLEALHANGLAVFHDNRFRTRGVTPQEPGLWRLLDWLERTGRAVVITHRLGHEEPQFADLATTASGLTALRVPHTDRTFVMWFRPELACTVRWAGDPRKGVGEVPAGHRMTPRKSFEAWLDEIRGTARPWTLAEKAIVGETVRNNLLDVLAKVQRRQIRDLRTYRGILFEQVNDAVVITDPEGIVTFWNDAAARLYGATREEMVGRPITHHAQPGQANAIAQMMGTIRGSGDVLSEHLALRKDGTPVWVDVRGQLLRGPAGDSIGFLGISRDISDRKQAESELRLLHAVATNLRDAILVTEAEPIDQPGPRILYANPAFVAQCGYTLGELIGKTPRILQSPRTDRASLDVIRAALRKWQPVRVELLNCRKDGSEFWVEIDIAPLSDETGHFTHWISVQRDVTERRILEDHVRQKQKLEAIGGLAAGVAHDFNNLLSVVNLCGSLLLEGMPPDHPDRGLVEQITRAGERGTALTGQLLAFGRRSIQKVEVFDPNAIIRETVQMLSRLLGDTITLKVSLSPSIGMVRADPGQFTQVIMNLVMNARDAMLGGGGLNITTDSVEVTPGGTPPSPDAHPGWYARLAVIDVGIGMDPSATARAFEPFYTTKPVGQGTGLGLSLVYGIVRQSGGFVTIDSSPGVGTTVQIYLPRHDAPPAGREPSLPAGLSLRATATETILVVEDDAPLRAVTAEALSRAGYRVVAAGDGAAALAECERLPRPPELVLTDVVMPVMGGPELAEQLTGRYPGIKIVYVSGYTGDAINDSRVAFLQKPYSSETLAWFVREVLDSP